MEKSASLDVAPILPRRKLAEEVAEKLLEALQGLEPGTRLPSEHELGRALGVGRSTLREALKGLEMLGIIEVRHGQGAFVAAKPALGQPPDAIRSALAKGVTQDLAEARRLIEGEIARLAASRRTESDMAELEATLASHRRAVSTGEDPMEPSAKFHVDLGEAAHNEILASFATTFASLMSERLHALYEFDPDIQAWEIADHEAVYEAIRRGDAQVALERMNDHVDQMAAHYERLGPT
jgi:GntR family transcriptional regulator, transcriptional repressor for pyruvate dehydrogenase complex